MADTGSNVVTVGGIAETFRRLMELATRAAPEDFGARHNRGFDFGSDDSMAKH
jgi:hypothetical protein